jgi:3-oxoadipate enol-lactonase
MRATTADGTGIWWEREGSGPAVLLVPGRGDATDLFPEALTSRLRAAGFSTLRYDPRDTGLSDDGGDTYTMSTMADDSIAVLDAAGVDATHVIGVSMAGLIMVDMAVRRPDRIASLLFVSAMSPDPEAGMGEDFFLGIEGDDPLDNYLRSMGEVSAADRAWVLAELEAASRRAPARPEAGSRHQEAAFRLEWPILEDLGRISAPTAVIHGRLDRKLPVAHGEALARGIAGATLQVRDTMGHIPRPQDWEATAATAIELADAG